MADFVLDFRPEDFPEMARHRAALLLLDTLGICAAAARMEASVLARRAAMLLHGAGDERYAARMLFDGRRASLAGAAFASATQIDNLDGHDGYNPTKGHIGVVALPTLAALAEHRPDLTGSEALAALIVGYEVAGRAGIALHASAAEYHASGAWNALGVAAMAGRLRRMTAAQLREALGIAEYQGPRSQMMREIATPTMLHDASGWGALVGLSSAILAEEGFTGAPAVTVEAPEAAPYWDDLGRFWQIEHHYVKPYPICRWAHAAIDAARELCLDHGLRAGMIAAIRIRSFDYAAALFQAMPDTTSKAQYSLPFAVATMIVHRRIGLEHISGEGLADPAVAALVARTRVSADPKHQARYPAERWADIDIALTDGRVVSSGDTHARGGPERPFEEEAITTKFMDFAVPPLGERRARAVLGATLALTEPGSRFADLARHLYES
ncbi:MAG TPA: MmgE/PrpD family protein [Lichenihabitans sp.]|nr:MmgE/PrpD family protein [Lichenihabitans sp.]